MTGHAGDWRWETNTSGDRSQLVDSRRLAVLYPQLAHDGISYCVAITDEHAALIAAAPELLAVLREIDCGNWLAGGSNIDDYVQCALQDRLTAVIRKAEGKDDAR